MIVNCCTLDLKFVKLLLIFLFSFQLGASFGQQNEIAAKMKRGFISNFYKYVEWPEAAIRDSFCIGILQNKTIAEEIKTVTKNNVYGEKKIPFKVVELNNLDRLSEFNMVYVDNQSGYSAKRLFDAIGENPVLLITENYGYNETMINFIIKDSRIKYQVNLSTMEPRNLVADNQVLQTAFKGESEDWNKQLFSLRLKLNQEKDVNKQLSKSIAEKEKILEEKEGELLQKEKDLDLIKDRIQAQKIKSDRLLKQLQYNDEIIKEKEKFIAKSDQKLKEQIKVLDEAKADYERVQKDMNQTMALLDNQKIFTTVAVFIAILIAILLLYSYQNYRKQKAQAKIINQQRMSAELQRDEISKQHVELECKTKEITDSINYAKRIQEAMLPPINFFHQNLPNSFVFYLPKDIVAGDFYWMEAAGDTCIFAAADCTGHGVPGALVSVICANALNRSVREYKLTEPASILDKTLEIVLEKFERSQEDVKDGMDIALCSFNKKTGTLQFAGANNPLWVIRKNSTQIEEYKADKQPIGSYLKHKPFTNHSLVLEDGDAAYIFSDGYVDQFGGERGKKFKSINLKALLASITDQPMEKQQTAVKHSFYNWMGNHEQLDDICMIGFRR